MITSIQYQGYTIPAPPGPSDQGAFTDSPTHVQVLSKVDHTFVINVPLTPEDVFSGQLTPQTFPAMGTVTLQCQWETIGQLVAQNAEMAEEVKYSVGVTTSDSDTTTFGITFGVEGGALEGIKTALSAAFSQSETHTVTLSKSLEASKNFKALPNTTLQVWQLRLEYVAEYESFDGNTYRYVLSTSGATEELPLILGLTFPETPA